MFYLGQAVFSKSIEIPMIYIGRKKKFDQKGEYDGYKYLVFANDQIIDDWDWDDIAPLVNKVGRIFKGSHNEGLLTGFLDVTSDEDLQDYSLYIEEVVEMIKQNKIKPLIY